MAASKAAEFVEVEEVQAEQPEQLELFEPIIVAPLTKRARVKGTWVQYFGTGIWNFEDGVSYDLPLDLFDYLRVKGCLYDTMA